MKMIPKKVLFIDRDGTLIFEPEDGQIDSLEKLEFFPKIFQGLSNIAKLDYELVMITNQDGLGTDSFPEDTFWPAHHKMMKALENEEIHFDEIYIDKTFKKDNKPTRKPGTGLLTKFIDNPEYDLANSYVIGDRLSDVELAKNLGAKGIWINTGHGRGMDDLSKGEAALKPFIALETEDWNEIFQFLKMQSRAVSVVRNTKETQIAIQLDLDGVGKAEIDTGLGFFNHMLEQIARHGSLNLNIKVNGDLEVDEHHTIEDTAIALGEAFQKALGSKLGIARYGFSLPMDDCLAQVAIDFGGRNWLVWKADFKREKVGDMPTEMFKHFFKSFTDGAKCNLNIKAEGENEHHKIESIFKALAKAIKMAVKRDKDSLQLPSTKGVL